MDAFEKLEGLVSTHVGKHGANFAETKDISQDDILLAQYSDGCLYRAQVSRVTTFQQRHWGLRYHQDGTVVLELKYRQDV